MPPKTSKCFTNYFSKLFIILLLLVILPFFPSEAPEFIKKTVIFTKSWELFHLFVIGTVVSYGLFSRRIVKNDRVTQSNFDSSTTYLSGIQPVSSFFEDGFENLCEFGDKKVVKSWDFDESWVLDRCKDYGSLNLEKGFRNPNLFNEENANVVVDKWGKPEFGNESKPLNLPVRSLRSRIVDNGPNVKGFDGAEENKQMTFRGLVPINLEEKFKETLVPLPCDQGLRSERTEFREGLRLLDTKRGFKETAIPCDSKNDSLFSSNFRGSNAFDKNGKVKIRGWAPPNSKKLNTETVVPSPLRWGSRSGRMELSVEVSNVVKPSKPPSSVGETEFECQKPFVRSSMPGFSTVCSDKPKSHIEGFNRKENLPGSFPPASQPSLAPSNGKSNRRRFSIGSSVEVTVERSSENNLKGIFNSEKEDTLYMANNIVDSLNSNVKPAATLVKGGLRRGRSVRTIRSSDKLVELNKINEDCSSHINVESVPVPSTSMIAGVENYAAERNAGKLSYLQNPMLGKNCSANEHDDGSSTLLESENVLKGRTKAEIVNEAQPECDEVDKKAGEFIAKFREQIRLQRVASMRRLNC